MDKQSNDWFQIGVARLVGAISSLSLVSVFSRRSALTLACLGASHNNCQLPPRLFFFDILRMGRSVRVTSLPKTKDAGAKRTRKDASFLRFPSQRSGRIASLAFGMALHLRRSGCRTVHDRYSN